MSTFRTCFEVFLNKKQLFVQTCFQLHDDELCKNALVA